MLFISVSILFCTQSSFSYYTKDSSIYTDQGAPVYIDGVAWIGFQDSNFFGGLSNVPFNSYNGKPGVIDLLIRPWTVAGSNISTEKDGVSFRTVRIPIQPGIWHNVQTTQKNPFGFNDTNMKEPSAGNGIFCNWAAGSDDGGHCKQSLKAPQLLDTTISELGKNNVRVMLDFHHRPGLGDNFRDGTVTSKDYTLQDYFTDIKNFSAEAKKKYSNVLGIDIYNEPHNLFWYGKNTEKNQPAWIDVIAAAASAVYQTKSNLLLFVEAPGGTTSGVDEYDPVFSKAKSICLPADTKVDDTAVIGLANDPQRCPDNVETTSFNTSTLQAMKRVSYIGSNWGENFRDLLDPTAAKKGVAKFDVWLFRQMLISSIKANHFSNVPAEVADWLLGKANDGDGSHIVFAPHLYGKNIAGWQSDLNDSRIRFRWNFGFLHDSGFATTIGELGFDKPIGGEDFFKQAVGAYLTAHNMNHNLFFWTWNQADGPPGIRANDAGYGLQAWKEIDLHNLFNDQPPKPVLGILCVTVPQPQGYTAKAYPIINAGNTQYHLTAFGIPLCKKLNVGTYALQGTTLQNGNNETFTPAKNYQSKVSKDKTTYETVQYSKVPTSSIAFSIAADKGCTISSSDMFAVAYQGLLEGNKVIITGKHRKTIGNLLLGDYAISVDPNALPNQPACVASYKTTAPVVKGKVAKEQIIYHKSLPPPVSTCVVKKQCSVWGGGNPGSSCNLYVTSTKALNVPWTLKANVNGISAITNAWNAKVRLSSGQLSIRVSQDWEKLGSTAVNVGFNANGQISDAALSNVVLSANGNDYQCKVSD